MRLDQAAAATADLPFGGTDCSLPMRWALERRIEADAFVVYTDAGMLDVVGFDTAAPALIADFIRAG